MSCFCSYILQCSVLLPVVMTLIANQAKDSQVAGAVARFCYTKWALEAFVVANAERFVDCCLFPLELATGLINPEKN